MRATESDRVFGERMLAVADALFREFGDRSLVEVVSAMNAARRQLSTTGLVVDPSRIADTARQRLRSRGTNG